MNNKLLAVLGVSSVFAAGVAVNSAYSPQQAGAENNRHVFYVQPQHTSGSVTLDSKNNVIAASSQDLLENNQNMDNSYGQVNNKWGRWVYYKDGYGKTHTGHSNFYSNKGKHFSWVAMGSKGRKYAVAGKGSYSYATQKGKGTFHAGYGMS